MIGYDTRDGKWKVVGSEVSVDEVVAQLEAGIEWDVVMSRFQLSSDQLNAILAHSVERAGSSPKPQVAPVEITQDHLRDMEKLLVACDGQPPEKPLKLQVGTKVIGHFKPAELRKKVEELQTTAKKPTDNNDSMIDKLRDLIEHFPSAEDEIDVELEDQFCGSYSKAQLEEMLQKHLQEDKSLNEDILTAFGSPGGRTLRLGLEVLREHRENFSEDSKTVTVTFMDQRVGTFTKEQLDERIRIIQAELSRIWKSKTLKDQPPPTTGEGDMWSLIIDRLRATMTERREFGILRYGQPVMAFTNRDALVDMFQEDLDRLVYFQQLLYERGKLQEAADEVSREIRKFDKKTKDSSYQIKKLIDDFLNLLGYGEIVAATGEFDALGEGELTDSELT